MPTPDSCFQKEALQLSTTESSNANDALYESCDVETVMKLVSPHQPLQLEDTDHPTAYEVPTDLKITL